MVGPIAIALGARHDSHQLIDKLKMVKTRHDEHGSTTGLLSTRTAPEARQDHLTWV